MATVYAANRPIETMAVGNMNEATAHQLPIPARLDDTMIAQPVSTDLPPSPRINLPPPPNPPFVFPSRPASTELSPFLPRNTGRRPVSAIELQGSRFGFDNGLSDQPRHSPALPDFSFNPGATLSPESAGRSTRSPSVPDLSLLSPPVSPHSPKGMPGHMGHRRGGSEFVGGKLRSGGSITVMNTSPIKSGDSLAPSPTLAPVPTPGHPRRGHAHRRSGAISSHDLSMILQPKSPSPSQGTSTPNTPADTDEKPPASPGLKPDIPIPPPKEDPEPEPVVEKVQEATSVPSPEPSPKPVTRARVGFSDTLEFIPRPLSLVSTDTSSTVRPGHSVSGSISSIISGTNSTFADRDSLHQFGSPMSPVSSAKSGSRPSTAGAILDRTPSLHTVVEDPASPRRRNSIPLLSELSQETPSLATPSPSRTPKRWSFFGLDPFASSGSPTRSRPVSPGSSDIPPKQMDPPVSPRCGPSSGDDRAAFDPEKSVTGKKKKQKKVKTWAGSILTRKSKSRSHKPKGRRRSATPPLHRTIRDEVDDDPIESSYAFTVPPVPIIIDTTYPSSDSEISRPRRIPDDDEDATYPMIDLDAALGPFNTPSSRDPKWDEAQKAGSTPKRQLHSAAGLRGFSGPGMHYHRRAESAPEMPPFEAARFGIHRFGSSSTMADVFEEDEEDDEDRDTTNASDESANETDGVSDIDDTASTPTQERDQYSTSSLPDAQVPAPVDRKGSGSSLEIPLTGPRMRTDASSISLHEDVIEEEGINYNRPRSEIVFPASSDGSSSAAPSPRRIPGNRDLGPTDSIVLPVPQMTPASPFSTAYSSSFPSPRSPVSYDARRISTAASSIADENNFHSLLMGEPGPEVVRISVEVPSLTSSNSTMTRESASAHGVRPRNMPFHEQRPASFTSTAFGRRRSSLASLSRLISSAHGERSKLSVEVPCDDEPEKKQKSSKGRRLSKMIQFWRPKSSSGA
ncbi:hypothetical protein F4810DRAFT_280039 [Camillea tinctor]|nr:hypothetical protein F4810DRAFT_280039 [Camillea tinctor]